MIHISKEFEDFIGYSLSDFKQRGIHLLFEKSAGEDEIIHALSKQVDLEVKNLTITSKDGRLKNVCSIINRPELIIKDPRTK